MHRMLTVIGAAVGGIVLVACGLAWIFGNRILNEYGRGKAENAFASAHPGSTLQIGELDYEMGATG